MANKVDDWLDAARSTVSGEYAATDLRRLHRKLDSVAPALALVARRREARMALACSAISAAFTVWIVVQLGGWAQPSTNATWIATPSAVSPFGLLVGI